MLNPFLMSPKILIKRSRSSQSRMIMKTQKNKRKPRRMVNNNWFQSLRLSMKKMFQHTQLSSQSLKSRRKRRLKSQNQMKLTHRKSIFRVVNPLTNTWKRSLKTKATHQRESHTWQCSCQPIWWLRSRMRSSTSPQVVETLPRHALLDPHYVLSRSMSSL